MSHFERTEGAEDNLGNNPVSFVPIEDMKDSSAESPDEILADVQLTKKGEDNEFIKQNVIDLDDIDNEPSNWESDVEEGRYDQFPLETKHTTSEIKPVHTVSRNNVSQIEEMKGREQLEKYWDVPSRKVDNSKPKRPQDDHNSIRFDEAV